MSIFFSSTYWLLGDGADEEAKRWVALDERKKIMYSSPRAVEFEEHGNYLSPELPIPPKGFLVVVISDNEAVQDGVTLGVAHWGGDGGWIERKEHHADHAITQPATRKSDETVVSEADFLEELKYMGDNNIEEGGVAIEATAEAVKHHKRFRVKLTSEMLYMIPADSSVEAEQEARSMLHQLFRYGEDDEWRCEIEELSEAEFLEEVKKMEDNP